MRKLVQRWVDRSRNNRNIQDNLDILRLFHLSSFYKNFKSELAKNSALKISDLTPQQIEDFSDVPLSKVMGYHDQKISLIQVLNKQVFNMLEYTVAIGGLNPYPKPSFNKKPNGDDSTSVYLDRKMNLRDVEVFHPGTDIEHPEKFNFRIQKSSIDHTESGYGVWIRGAIIPGTVVAFYPGVVYYPHDLTKEVILGNDYMISRYDYTVIDGKHWDRKSEILTKKSLHLPYASGTQMQQADLCKYRNPFGIGNYINHPPPNAKPNVVSFGYDFPINTPEHLKPYIPNSEFKSSIIFGKIGCYMRSLVFVTSCHVCDEELFYNYRFNPANSYPDWYTQPDEEEAKRRWSALTVLPIPPTKIN